MERAQFMEQLKRLLSDISESERAEALDYYESYFDDAGPENEEQVIRELGSPGKVAAIIKADLRESNDHYAEYTEHGYEDSREAQDTQMPEKRTQRGYHAGKKKNSGMIILILILLVFAFPFIKGAVGGVAGLVLAIAMIPFLIVFGLGAAALALIIGAIACVASGIALCVTSIPLGILTIGVGLLLMALGLVFLTLLIGVAGKILPKLLRKFTDFCQNLLHRERKGGERA